MIWVINPITLLLVYIAYAWLYTARLKVRWLAGPYYLVLVVGGLLDLVVNITWFTVILLDWPREWLLTQRVERLKNGSGYRARLAQQLCEVMNYFQEGHCK